MSSSSWWFYDWLWWCLLATWLKKDHPMLLICPEISRLLWLSWWGWLSHLTLPVLPAPHFVPILVEKASSKWHQSYKPRSQSSVLGCAKWPPRQLSSSTPHPQNIHFLWLALSQQLLCAGACTGGRPVEFILLPDTGFQSQVQPVDLSSGTSSVLVTMTNEWLAHSQPHFSKSFF